VAKSLNNLATLYFMQGQYAQAELFYKQSLEVIEKALGPDHPDLATTLENLAELFRKTNRISEAELLEARVVRIRAIKR
jgi:tetratricopeptide (TPR) repeat protein